MLDECLEQDITEIKLLQEHLHDGLAAARLRPDGEAPDDLAGHRRGLERSDLPPACVVSAISHSAVMRALRVKEHARPCEVGAMSSSGASPAGPTSW